MSLPVWLPDPMFLLGIFVPGPVFLLGVSVQEGLCPGGGGVLCDKYPLHPMPATVAGGTHPNGMNSCSKEGSFL